jgi:spore coat protein A, manganese oxidase
MNRRKFLQQSGLLATVLAADPAKVFSASRNIARSVVPSLDPNSLARFVDALPILPIVRSTGSMPDPANPHDKLPYFRVAMREFESKLHRDLPPTRQWGYGSIAPGPVFETRKGSPLFVEWVNELPRKHFLPIDRHLSGAEADKPDVRAVVHLHGGKTPPESDGYPEDWYVPGKSALYRYPNNQDATMLWYHDHAMGINRLNIYAGLMGLFLIRDSVEDALNLPQGRYEIPMVIYDRMLKKDGQLDYPVSENSPNPWVPEVFGNAILVNGKLFPYLDVEPRKYRFRILNGSNGRFFHLSLANGESFHQIGSDQGLLAAPVAFRTLMIAPAERVDFIIDFGGHAGEEIILQNDAFVVMQFRVSRTKTDDRSSLPKALQGIQRIPELQAIKTRRLSLDEYEDNAGNSILMLLNKSYWRMPVTENPALNSTEIWEFINPTDDSHPIHLHLVKFQILDRRRFESFAFQTRGEVKFTGPAEPPDANEMGWKDTVRADPGMVTRIIVPFEGYAGRYVWHCHILEHEDNEMMRPYDVVAPT